MVIRGWRGGEISNHGWTRMDTDGDGSRAVIESLLALVCGDLSPLSRGDLSPSNCGERWYESGRSQLAPALACARVRTPPEHRRRQVACAKAVTSHRTPKGAPRGSNVGLHPCSSVSIRGCTYGARTRPACWFGRPAQTLVPRSAIAAARESLWDEVFGGPPKTARQRRALPIGVYPCPSVVKKIPRSSRPTSVRDPSGRRLFCRGSWG